MHRARKGEGRIASSRERALDEAVVSIRGTPKTPRQDSERRSGLEPQAVSSVWLPQASYILREQL